MVRSREVDAQETGNLASFLPWCSSRSIQGSSQGVHSFRAGMAEVRASQVAQWRAHEGACLGACFSHDGAYVLTGGQDRVVRLWTAREGSASPKALQTFVGHGRSVRGVACSVDGDRVASCSAAGEARVWDVRTARSLRVLRGHVAAAHAVSFVGVDDAMAVTGSEDASVMLWDLRASSHKPVQTMREASDSVTCVFGWKDGVVAAGADGCVRTYDVRRGKCVADACGAPVSCVSFAEDGVRAVAACLDHRMAMYDRSDGMHLATFRGHRSESVRTGCAFVAGDRHVACGSEDGRVCVWDAMPACRTGAGGEETPVLDLQAHVPGRAVCAVVSHPTRPKLLSTAEDGMACIHRLHPGP